MSTNDQDRALARESDAVAGSKGRQVSAERLAELISEYRMQPMMCSSKFGSEILRALQQLSALQSQREADVVALNLKDAENARLQSALRRAESEAARYRSALEAWNYWYSVNASLSARDEAAALMRAALAPAAERPPGAEGSLSAAKGECWPSCKCAMHTDGKTPKCRNPRRCDRGGEDVPELPAAKREQEKCSECGGASHPSTVCVEKPVHVTWSPDDGSMHPKANPAMYDAGQHRLNGGPYCYHVRDGKYCGAAKRWAGHGAAGFHDFVAEPATPERKP